MYKKAKKEVLDLEIQLNGEPRQVVAANIAELIGELGIERRMIAIERNLEVVPKSAYTGTRLEPGDRIELVHMIGGG
ncbi:MAG: sulfur carrier protein ThiS [Mariprofundaceae bacterium]|nr:sulfur carrier protein ThiS [Mariprofundaceae bacterium]